MIFYEKDPDLSANDISFDGQGTIYLEEADTVQEALLALDANINNEMSGEIDGGVPDSIYLQEQIIDAGEV